MPRIDSGLRPILATTGSILLLAPAAVAVEPVDYQRDVRPILAAKCWHCHGPDASVRKAELRLDRADEALFERKIIVPGKPAESELVRR